MPTLHNTPASPTQPLENLQSQNIALLIFIIMLVLLLAILFCVLYKKCKKDHSKRHQNREYQWVPQKELPGFFYLDSQNKIPISIRCREFTEVREGRLPYVIEEDCTVDQEYTSNAVPNNHTH